MSGLGNLKVYKCTVCPFVANFLSNYNRHLITHSSDRPFKCPELNCPYRAKGEHSVKRHVQSVHLFQSPSFRPFPCPHPGCNYAAKEKSTLNRHSKVHSGEKSFFCSHPNCNYSTNNNQSLISHFRIHTGEKPFVCQFESCFFAAATSSHLGVHTRTHTKERPYKCSEANCEYSTAQNSNLKTHELAQHPREGEERPSFQCPLCEYSTTNKPYLTAHVKSHILEKLFKCDETNCIFEAKRKADMENHKLLHSDEKPFACPVESCEYRCKRKRVLENHLKTHSEKRRYKCELCPYRAKTRSVVLGHLRDLHSDRGLGSFKCTEDSCDAAFHTKRDLNTHLLIHKGDKKYACSFSNCGYRTVHKSNVKTHEINAHSEEKKERRPICDYTCKMKSALTTQLRTHTKETPYSCKDEGCEYQTKTSSGLRRHEKRRHSHILK